MYSYHKIWKVSFPIMLSLLAQNVMQITDTVLMGRVGEVEFGATGLAGIFYIAFFTLAFGFSTGCQIIISQRNGSKDYNKIGTIVIHGIAFLFVLAFVLFFASRSLAQFFLPHVIKSPEVYAAAQEYLNWRTFGFFFSFVNVVFRAFYIGTTRTNVLTLNAGIMAIINFVAAYGLIFGNFGLPQMGIAGAGLASVIAEASSVVFFFIYTYATVDLKKYGFHFNGFRLEIIRKVLGISVYTMAQYCISLSTWFIFFLAIENHGERDLAITNTLRTFYMLFFIPMNAFSSTANTLVGNIIGEGRKRDVIPLIFRICKINLVNILLVAGITAIFPQFWISLIVSTKDLSLVNETVLPLYVLLLALPVCSVGSTVFNAVIGTGNTNISLAIEAGTIGVYLIALWWIVIRSHAPIAVCWTIEIIYWSIQLVLSVAYFKWGNWQKRKI